MPQKHDIGQKKRRRSHAVTEPITSGHTLALRLVERGLASAMILERNFTPETTTTSTIYRRNTPC